MDNSLSIISRAGQRMDMKWLAWLQSPTCQNAQLTFYDCKSRTNNGHEMISMITVTDMPACITHLLWSPEQDEEWTCDDQHDYGHQHASMHNSPPMIAKAGQRMDIGWSAWWQSPTCQNGQLTSYDCQSRTGIGHGIFSMIISPMCKNVQLTSYDCQSRIKSDDQHDHGHQHARMHNSPTVIATVWQTMDMG